MHTLSHFTLSHLVFATWITPSLAAIRDRFVECLRRRRARAEARRAALAFERLDDRTLRDLGFYRGDACRIGRELDALWR
jgi:uncharacterized protein YjiS (DUF1127 family)